MNNSTDRESRRFLTQELQPASQGNMNRLHEISRNRFEIREDSAVGVERKSAAIEASMREIAAKKLEIENINWQNSELIRAIGEMSLLSEELTRQNSVLDHCVHELRNHLDVAQSEVVRYQTLVELIFKSHRWKIGNFLFKLRPTARKLSNQNGRSKILGTVAADGAVQLKTTCNIDFVSHEQEPQFELLEPIGNASLQRILCLCRELEQVDKREFDSRMDQTGDRIGSALLEVALLGIGRDCAEE
jgi:hypothetical protein